MGSGLSLPSSSASLSSTATVPTVTHPTDCPPVQLTTRTFSSTVTVPAYTSTVTQTTTIYASTISTTASIIGQIYNPNYVYTTTITDTGDPSLVIEQVPFTATVTVPTSSGFTPVLCEATYQQPYPPSVTVTSTVSETQNSVSYIVVRNPGTSTYSTNFVQGYATIDYLLFRASYTVIVPTVTSTRTNPVQTIYEACKDSNLVSLKPTGGYIVLAFTGDPNRSALVVALDPTDCCAICQGNSSCFGSAYRPHDYPQCTLFLQDPTKTGVCDPTYTGAYLNLSNDTMVETYVSNTGCGQVGPLPGSPF